jgi:formate hydrogenlyase subunit 3/multisubunit Na+/H+ antiporter MnhD subunit
MFILLGWSSHSMEFSGFQIGLTPGFSGVIFLLAIIGFGTKAGFIPMHVWLPEAHPAAPSPVSAVMSGVMIKTGIYGLLRVITLLGEPSPWWGWTLIGIGAISGVVGVLFALAQHDLKRLLAYHSVENIGIIALGLGLGLLGLSYNNYSLSIFGFFGGLLHVWNHAIFKSLLFLSSGAVVHATGSRNIESLGGLLKKMPITGVSFLIGSAAISGLPPLNGFVSEFLIYLGAFSGLASASGSSSWIPAAVLVIGSLALIGGLAAACFAKAFGIVFLGELRDTSIYNPHEVSRSMYIPMLILAGLCFLIGLASPLAIIVTAPVVKIIIPKMLWVYLENIKTTSCAILWKVSLVATSVLVIACILWFIRKKLLAGRQVEHSVTWGCGYVAVNPRMQYTASSFAWPIISVFRWILHPKVHVKLPAGLFPKDSKLETHTDDVVQYYWYRPIFLGFDWVSNQMRWLQQGRNQLYVLYVALTLLVLLVWKIA